MTQTLEAVFDGKAIYPDEPILLEPHTRVRIVIEILPETEAKPAPFLEAAKSLKLDGSADWATDLASWHLQPCQKSANRVCFFRSQEV